MESKKKQRQFIEVKTEYGIAVANIDRILYTYIATNGQIARIIFSKDEYLDITKDEFNSKILPLLDVKL